MKIKPANLIEDREEVPEEAIVVKEKPVDKKSWMRGKNDFNEMDVQSVQKSEDMEKLTMRIKKEKGVMKAGILEEKKDIEPIPGGIEEVI